MKDSEDLQAARMGHAPIGKLLFSMAVPMMLSMLVQALYNVVDSVFVAHLSEDALTAVSMAFPVQNVMIAIAVGIGVGTNALISRKLGEGNRDEASTFAMQGYFLSTCAAILFVAVGFFLTDAFVRTQVDFTQPNGQAIYEGCVSYLRIACVLSAGIFFQCLEEKLLTATGKTMLAMTVQMSGALMNIILDPIMIFGLFGCPAMGIQGAALATVIGQCTGGLVGLILGITKNTDLKLKWADFRPRKSMLGNILSISVPSMLMMSIMSLLTYLLNMLLIGFSSTAVAVSGAFFKLQSFVMMPIFGINCGMVPIIAYNYGAGNRERVQQVVKLALISAVTIMFAGFLVFFFAPDKLLSLFDPSAAMLEIGIPALRITSISFVFAGIAVIIGSVCQAFGYAVYSLITTTARQIVILLPCAYLLSLSGNVDYIWYAWPIAEIGAIVLSFFFLKRVFRKTGMHLEKE